MFNHRNLSDKAVQAAIDEYSNAIGSNVGEWFAMKHAIETAISVEDKRFKKPKKTEEQAHEDFGFILLIVAASALVIGMIARWLA